VGLSSALSIANSGLASINAQFALLSSNIANASTPAYSAEVSNQQDVTADGVGLGVHIGPAVRRIDQTLQSSLTQQNGVVANLQTTQAALQSIDATLGTPGSGNDLGSLVGNLQNGFSALLTDPANQTQQTAVVQAASTLAQGINQLGSTYTAQRQAAEDDLASSVSTLNTTLSTIGTLNQQIVALQAGGQSTADLENQRDAAVQTVSGLVGINTVEQTNGNLLILTSGGLSLPTDGSGTLSIASAAVGPETYYPGGGLPGITLNGSDVTNQMTGGQIGADITLRDKTLPTDQAELDEFSYNLASRFSSQGLTLFTDPAGNVPSGGGTPAQSGYVGFSSTIQVNPAVTSQPSLVRDGTDTIADGTNGASAFAPNPSDGPSGFSTLINRVLNFTFGTQAQVGTSQPAMTTSSLGASGTLTAPINGAGVSLMSFANSLVEDQSQQSASVTSQVGTEQSLQSSLNAKRQGISGVNMDSEMSQMLTLQNAYGVNARVITAVQNMFNQLLQVIP
jgi:flagellar hook-associated protein 1